MTFDVYLISVLFSLFFLAIVINLIRRRKLKEQYSLLWIFVSILMLLFSLNRNSLEIIAAWLNIKYAPSMLFLFGLVFSFTLTLHLTTVVSKQSERIVNLTQDFAILRQEFQALCETTYHAKTEPGQELNSSAVEKNAARKESAAAAQSLNTPS